MALNIFCHLDLETRFTIWGLTSAGHVTLNVMNSSTNVISATALPIVTYGHILFKHSVRPMEFDCISMQCL
jgi:hypothetical protein